MLEMDRLERQLVNLPLLQDPSSYIPDTMDLTEDALAREYWLYCFEEALEGVGCDFIVWTVSGSEFKMCPTYSASQLHLICILGVLN